MKKKGQLHVCYPSNIKIDPSGNLILTVEKCIQRTRHFLNITLKSYLKSTTVRAIIASKVIIGIDASQSMKFCEQVQMETKLTSAMN